LKKRFTTIFTLGIMFTASVLTVTAVTVNQTATDDNDETLAQSAALRSIGSGALMQGFYWDVPAGGNWYNTMKGKASEIATAGFDCV
jgi:alpha-amylase